MFAAGLEAMVEHGAGLLVGTVSPDGEPRATRAWSAVVVDQVVGRVRVAVSADDPQTLANLASGSTVALTGADVRTLDSLQVKGRVERIEPPNEHDRATIDVQTDRFLWAVHETDGNPIEMLRRFLPHEVVMIEMMVDESFDQTPGPDAGARLGRR
jgi:hypothetical protein